MKKLKLSLVAVMLFSFLTIGCQNRRTTPPDEELSDIAYSGGRYDLYHLFFNYSNPVGILNYNEPENADDYPYIECYFSNSFCRIIIPITGNNKVNMRLCPADWNVIVEIPYEMDEEVECKFKGNKFSVPKNELVVLLEVIDIIGNKMDNAGSGDCPLDYSDISHIHINE